ncbi:FAD dependent oxidoreductase [Crucibulum laeve]|uniref:FAD dependent oxidoreductase n=1 Tax=Crucibulum laeve TaxID=68775 RepID=A0A5C3MHN3_9AGAR|nr:FAD dependent oxidoreductase [Crucibulum laeve]
MILLGEKIVIVGSGCFGISTAYHLLKRGYTDVTVLDRSSTLPAQDAASNDFNRIIRSSYSDRFYAELARDAILSWKFEEKWGDTYHESGVVVLGLSGSGSASYADDSYVNDIALGANVQQLVNGDAIRSVFPAHAVTSSFQQYSGYLNRDGGWANASKGLSLMISKVRALNGKICPEKQVKTIIQQGGKATGVECTDGDVFSAALVILATGSWTPSAFPDLDLGNKCLATGQCIAMIQLSEDEANSYRDCPVVLNFASGFYVFPPNENNVIKMAMHGAGYTNMKAGISTPRTVISDPDRGLCIPKIALQELRQQLKNVYPELAQKPFSSTRLCWYNDTSDGDWIISRHFTLDSLVLATAGNGHAYKFLPVIGRLVADLVQDKLDPLLVQKFAIDRTPVHSDLSRSGQVVELDLNQLCTPSDLLNLL